MTNNEDTLPRCAFCDSLMLREVVDLGTVALAGAFLKPEQFSSEKLYPLRLYYCEQCFAVQVIDKISPDILFKDYFYFSSAIATLKKHFRSYATEVSRRFVSPDSGAVLEFGCNDGVLLKPLADEGIQTVIGVDPASNVVASIDDPRVEIVNDYFTEAVAEKILSDYGAVDVVMANNVYAHIIDIQAVTRAVERVLKSDGVFIFEVHYLGKVISEMQYDMIYHEHLFYYSLISVIEHFKRYQMVVFDVKAIPIHAGSMRFYVCKEGSKHSATISERVILLRDKELADGFNRYETFERFSLKMAHHKEQLMEQLFELKKKSHSIAGYGASGRANTIIQYCGISHDELDYVIDDAPAKTGFYTPGSHLRVIPSSILSTEHAPSYVLVFAWSFFDEILERNESYIRSGGRMILPLPELRLYPTDH